MRQSLNSPPEIPDPSNPVSLTYDHGITLHVDATTFDFHIDAPENYPPEQLRWALAQARKWGLEPLDPDNEDDAELMEAGTIRIQLTPVVPEPSWLAPFADQIDTLLIGCPKKVKS